MVFWKVKIWASVGQMRYANVVSHPPSPSQTKLRGVNTFSAFEVLKELVVLGQAAPGSTGMAFAVAGLSRRRRAPPAPRSPHRLNHATAACVSPTVLLR